MSKLGKAFQAAKRYFSLQRDDGAEGYDFAVESKPLKGATMVESLRLYFDLASGHHAGDRLADEIMKLANAEGVATAIVTNSPTRGHDYSFSYSEGNFGLKTQGSRVLLKCDATFAEKVGKLPSALSVTTLKKRDAGPTAKPDVPKS